MAGRKANVSVVLVVEVARKDYEGLLKAVKALPQVRYATEEGAWDTSDVETLLVGCDVVELVLKDTENLPPRKKRAR